MAGKTKKTRQAKKPTIKAAEISTKKKKVKERREAPEKIAKPAKKLSAEQRLKKKFQLEKVRKKAKKTMEEITLPKQAEAEAPPRLPSKPLYEPRKKEVHEDEKTFALMWSVIFSTVLTGVFAFLLGATRMFKENYYFLVIIFWILLTLLIYLGKRRGMG